MKVPLHLVERLAKCVARYRTGKSGHDCEKDNRENGVQTIRGHNLPFAHVPVFGEGVYDGNKPRIDCR